MIRLILFDFDGVLFDAKHLHFRALNQALALYSQDYSISWDEHLTIFDGLTTRAKLQKLKIPEADHDQIFVKKQDLTQVFLNEILPNRRLKGLLQALRRQEYQLACCSNSIRPTLRQGLQKLDLLSSFDFILSNEEVRNPKPHPEIYWTAMARAGVLPEETLIIEDAPNGLRAAHQTGAHLWRVASTNDLTLFAVKNHLQSLSSIPPRRYLWTDPDLTVLIPMAGGGSRFKQAGYALPKPLIDVKGKPMIERVIENLAIDANYVFLVQRDHERHTNITAHLKRIKPDCSVLLVDGLTEGAACTTLLAKSAIPPTHRLLIANSDQLIEWDATAFFYAMQESHTAAGAILTFQATDRKWSFAKVEKGLVTQVAEKNPISTHATVGIYYFRYAGEYFLKAEQMITKEIRTNNEFYICPVFNEFIQAGLPILPFPITKMYGLGTPEDLERYVRQ